MEKKEIIINALLAVMERYAFSLITVTQIAQEAKIGRKTFYRHFKNKDEVLEEAVNRLFLEYASLQQNYYAPNYEPLVYQHFLFWQQHLDFLKLLHTNQLMLFMFKQYQNYIPLLNQTYLANKNFSPVTARYANAFTTGIFWSMLYTWIESGAQESPRKLAGICAAFLKNRVQAEETQR